MLRWGLAAALLACCAPELASESVTLSTYYPAPSGVYTQMITTANTYLARDGGGATMVGVGTASPAYKLDVNGTGHFQNDLTVTGNETVAGSLTVNNAITGPYGLLPRYANWAAYGTGDGGAAIYNDNNGYKTLMVVGNNSAGGTRHVGIWDDLTVNGSETVASNLQVNGNTTLNGTLLVGGVATFNSNVYAQQGLSVAQSMVARQTGCFFVRWTVGGTNTPTTPACNGGYITNQTGVYSEWMSAPSFLETMNGTDAPGSGTALCCPYGAIGGPWF